MKTIAVTQQKGGVGKTATAVHLAAGLARSGHATLIIDLDPQAPVAPHLGVSSPADLPPLAAAVADRRLDAVTLPTPTPGLFVAPGDAGLDPAAFARLPMRETLLRRALDALGGAFDFVVLDTPPSLDLVTLNAVMAADLAVLPCDADAESVKSLGRTMRVIETYLQFRPEIDPVGFARVLVTLTDPRRRVLNAWAAAQLAPLAGVTLDAAVHKSEAFPKARANGETVFAYAARNPAGTARSVRELDAVVAEVVGLTTGEVTHER
jgi:chromosome partitioning protein